MNVYSILANTILVLLSLVSFYIKLKCDSEVISGVGSVEFAHKGHLISYGGVDSE